METTTFLLWSAAATSQPGAAAPPVTALESAIVGDPDLAVEERLSSRRSPALRPAKKKKPAVGQKRPPQRGLGVEKLERLRLQERWRMMTEIDPPLDDQQMRSAGVHGVDRQQALLPQYSVAGEWPAVLHSPFVQPRGGSHRMGLSPAYAPQNQAVMGGMSLAKLEDVPEPVGYGGDRAVEAHFLQRNRLLGLGGLIRNGGAFASCCTFVNHEDGAGDGQQLAAALARIQADGSPLELPSSQSSTLSERCDARSREEKLASVNEIGGGARQGKKPNNSLPAADLAFFEEIQDRNRRSMEIKVFEFFPCNMSREGCTILRRRPGGEVPSSVCPLSSKDTHLDLSLKLSSQ